MEKVLYTTPAGAVKYSHDNGQLIIHSGELKAISYFLAKQTVKARVHVKNPLSGKLGHWQRNGPWVYSSVE